MTRDMERTVKKLKDTARRLDAVDTRGPDLALSNSVASSLRMLARNLETRGVHNLVAAEDLIAKYNQITGELG